MGLYFCGIPPSNQLEKYYKMEVEEVWTPLPELEMKLFFFSGLFFLRLCTPINGFHEVFIYQLVSSMNWLI